MKQSPHTRWKGCAMCKPHKNDKHGDTVRFLTRQMMRQAGKKRRWNRHEIPKDQEA